MRVRILGAVVLVLILGACATIPPSQDETRVLQLIDLFNTQTELIDQTGLPFLFGEEVLYASADVAAVLSRVKASGLVLTPDIAGNTDAIVITGTDRFAVEVYADGLPPDARQILVPSTAGTISLIVGGEANGLPLLLGLQRRDS